MGWVQAVFISCWVELVVFLSQDNICFGNNCLIARARGTSGALKYISVRTTLLVINLLYTGVSISRAGVFVIGAVHWLYISVISSKASPFVISSQCKNQRC